MAHALACRRCAAGSRRSSSASRPPFSRPLTELPDFQWPWRPMCSRSVSWLGPEWRSWWTWQA
eukprot:9229372-Pyramimonas_sp.AAC.1